MTPTAKKYKYEAEMARQSKDTLARELAALREQMAKDKKEKDKYWSATVYCDNCLEVSDVRIPPNGNPVKSTDCVVCRVKGGLHLVRKVRDL